MAIPTMINPPIDPLEYLAGIKVVDIGDLRVARGKTRRPVSTCKHKSIVYDRVERRVRCKDCEQEIEPFDAFMKVVEQHDAAWKAINLRAAEIEEAEKFTLRRRATKAIDKVWRGKMLPCCVECGTGMHPEDYVNIGNRVSREFAEAQRKRREPT